MKANYHAHTYRCHHAYGCEWEYVEEAIRQGLTTLGFADHAPHCYPEGYKSSRMLKEQLAEYVGTINKLKKLYGDRIEILCGLEAEYYPALFEQDMELYRSVEGLDYLILGQHYCHNEYDTEYHVTRVTEVDQEDLLTTYVNQVIEAMKTGRYLYVAHPDNVVYRGSDAHYEQEMRRLCKAACELGVPLEINLSGYRYKATSPNDYPNDRFWKIAGEEHCTAVLGSDSHRPNKILIPEEVMRAEELAAKNGITILETLTLG
ncbi:MAG: histidinol-phosphatase [Clostridia bacterium]|nr:histidinol-phosphatase [Clostridia bacterium]